VSLGLHKHLIHNSSPLSGAIAAYVQDVEEEREKEMEAAKGVPQQYWWQLTAPKACADIVESLLGAVLVDSGFDLGTARAFFDRLYRPFMEHYCRPENAMLSSAESLFEILLSRRCTHWRITEVSSTEPATAGEQDETGMDECADADGWGVMEEADKQPVERTVQILVHGQVCGDVKSKGASFSQQLDDTMLMLNKWRDANDDVPAETEILGALKMLWPWPLRTKKMCMPRLMLEALCQCNTAQESGDEI